MDKYSKEVKTLLAGICNHGNHNLTFSEAKEALENLDNSLCNDFTFELDGNEYRIISDSSIWYIYVETIKEIVYDCHDLNLDNIPSFIAFEIDWEQTAQNAYVDGYGHAFASYDGEESEAAGYYIFRIN